MSGYNWVQNNNISAKKEEQKNVRKRKHNNFNESYEISQPFGSKSKLSETSSEPRHSLRRQTKKGAFNFEFPSTPSGSSSSSNSSPEREPNSSFVFGLTPKLDSWGSKEFSNRDQVQDTLSGESTKNVRIRRSREHINLGEMVESIFMDEIGKMAQTSQMS